MIAKIHKNFWLENAENVVYKGLYQIFECISRLNPACWFSLPLIETKLQEVANNTTKYRLWGKGNGFYGMYVFEIYFHPKNLEKQLTMPRIEHRK